MTPLIACCKSGNDELLNFFLEEKLKENDPTLIKLRRLAKDNQK